MIPREKQLKLIQIYMYICDVYQCKLHHCCQRFSNNSTPAFTDQELITVYLFTACCQRYFRLSEGYTFASEYLRSWFPKLPSYQAYNRRLNRLSEAFRVLGEDLMERFIPPECQHEVMLIDSLPIITCAGKNRKPKVATAFVSKGYCAAKDLYFFGLRLHALNLRQKGALPFPHRIAVASAECNDLAVFKQAWGDELYDVTVYGDKAYSDKPYFNAAERLQNLTMRSPIKAVKGQPACLKQRDKAYNNLWDTAVSTIRQPIESFFNWLNEKTNIQRAQKVRSALGLLVHCLGKIAIALMAIVFNY
jgi:hypothetical protein